jgi:hypothetical protein
MKKGYKNNISYTRLKSLYTSFAAFENIMEKPKTAEKKEPSEGSLAHWALFEPYKFADVKLYKNFEKRKKADKERYLKMSNDNQYLCTLETYKKVMTFKKNCLNDSNMKKILDTGIFEQYIKEPFDDYTCSGYIDILQPLEFGLCNLYDLKFLEYRPFNTTYNTMRYGLQAGIYATLAERLGYEIASFYFIHIDHQLKPVFRLVRSTDLKFAQKEFINCLNYITMRRNNEEFNKNSLYAPAIKRQTIWR